MYIGWSILICFPIQDPSDFNLNSVYQMSEYLALKVDVAHNPSLLKVFV